MQVAQETVLPLHAVSFRGKKFQDIRTAMNERGQGRHPRRVDHYSAAPMAIRDQIQAISEEWVADKKVPEMGFTLGSLDELDDPEVRCLIAVDADTRSMASHLGCPSTGTAHVIGWTLDFMRRRSDGFRASIDFLIGTAALDLQDEGVDFVSLSGAPLARPPHDPRFPHLAPETAGALDRLLDWLGASLEPVYGFRSLLAFKSKFKPSYIPMYMLFPDAAALPAIANAVTRAYLPSINVGQGLTLARGLLRRRARTNT